MAEEKRKKSCRVQSSHGETSIIWAYFEEPTLPCLLNLSFAQAISLNDGTVNPLMVTTAQPRKKIHIRG